MDAQNIAEMLEIAGMSARTGNTANVLIAKWPNNPSEVMICIQSNNTIRVERVTSLSDAILSNPYLAKEYCRIGVGLARWEMMVGKGPPPDPIPARLKPADPNFDASKFIAELIKRIKETLDVM